MFYVQITTIQSDGEFKFLDLSQQGYPTLEEANAEATKAFDTIRNVLTIEITQTAPTAPSLTVVS